MKNLIIIALLFLVGFMYMNRGGDVDYWEELKKMPQEMQTLVSNLQDSEKRDKLRVEIQKVLNAVSDKLNIPKVNVAGNLLVEGDDDVYLSITLNTGFVAEGKFLKKTSDGDHVLALPGSKITIAHDRIKSIRTLEGDDKEILKIMLEEAAAKKKSSSAPRVAQLDAPIQWEKDFDVALKKASAQRRPLMVDFYTDWCGWCKKMDKDVFQNKKVRRLLREHFICVKINGDKERTLVQQYHVQGFPNIIFMDSNGGVMYQQPGYVPVSTFTEIVETVVEKLS